MMLAQKNKTRTCTDLRLFDCYAIAGTSTRPPLAPALTADTLLAEMNLCGVDEALVHTAAVEISSPLVTNLDVVKFCTASPRLHPVWNLLPPQTGEMPVNKLLSDMRANGVKVLCALPDENRYLLNGITFGETFDAMIAHRIPLFLRGNWQRITDVLREFPQLIVIAAEYGCWGQDRFIRPLMERFESFYIETSTLELDGGIPSLMKDYGPNRILFGSSYHRRPMGGAALLLRNLDIDPDAKERIAHGNLERLLEESKP